MAGVSVGGRVCDSRASPGMCGCNDALPLILVEKLLCQSREAATREAEGACDGWEPQGKAATLILQKEAKFDPLSPPVRDELEREICKGRELKGEREILTL